MSSKNMICRSVRIGLHFVGIWPGKSCSVLHQAFWITSMTLFLTFEYRYFIMQVQSENLSELVDVLSVALPYSQLCFKLAVFWTNRRVFRDVLEKMNTDSVIYLSPESHDLTVKAVHLCHRLSNTIIFLHVTCVVIYAIGFFLSQMGQDDMASRELLLKMKLPFDIYKSPIYQLVIIVQFLHQVTSSTTVGIITSVLIVLTLHVGCQIDIMCHQLNKISYYDMAELKRMISRHQEIIEFVENINKLFGSIALMQCLLNTLIICCVGFLMIISIGTEDALATITKCLLFYVVITLEIFVYCFVGEYLSTKSRMIGNAAYLYPWYELSSEKSRLFFMIILRSQKPSTISVGKFMNLSLQFFMAIMKASASYISVLLAMY